MPEIKKDLIKYSDFLVDDLESEDHIYVITEDHSLADVVRWLVHQAGGTEDIQYLLDEIDREGELD